MGRGQIGLMEISAIVIQCSNPNCQANNSLANQACEQCGTPLIRRYLWAVGNWIKVYRLGELLKGRYLLKHPRILLDTQPALPPGGPEEMPSYLLPYFKLFPYQPHIPQIGGYIPSPDEELNLEVILLEYGTVPLDSQGELRYPNLLPELAELWPEASPLQQLSWLRQIVQLWEPLESQRVAQTLLEPSLLRINGGILQLLELRDDGVPAPSLSQLGETWSPLVAGATPAIADFLQELCENLQQGAIPQSQQLAGILDRAIAQCGQWQQQTCQIFTATATGPTRQHNEDACYPSQQESLTVRPGATALAIVCDGIGGQEAGEVASQLAIETLLAQREALIKSEDSFVSQQLKYAIRACNNAINERNNRENRHDLQRMGTTLVLALARNHEIYLAHVGDSRLYRITPESCHQVTVDDDLASREVRLGYLLYRDAIRYPNSGALIQALGINDSRSLHPSLQRLILDEDCLFLLCSDGLSDRDRVEQYWQAEIAPLFAGERELAEVGRRLMEIANEQNGHDNVTIALLYFQVQPRGQEPPADREEPGASLTEGAAGEAGTVAQPLQVESLSFAQLAADFFQSAELEAGRTQFAEATGSLRPYATTTPGSVEQETRGKAIRSYRTVARPPRRQWQLLLLAIASLTLLGVGVITYSIWRLTAPSPQDLSPSPTPSTAIPTLAEGKFFQVGTPLPLQRMPQMEANPSLVAGEVPSGSTLKVLQVGPTGAWLQLQVCQLPPPTIASSNTGTLSEGQSGWIQASYLDTADITPISVTGQSLGSCSAVKAATETPLNR